jgi:hypothetical protein
MFSVSGGREPKTRDSLSHGSDFLHLAELELLNESIGSQESMFRDDDRDDTRIPITNHGDHHCS